MDQLVPQVESIKRLGGDPKHPFPLEEELETEETAFNVGLRRPRTGY